MLTGASLGWWAGLNRLFRAGEVDPVGEHPVCRGVTYRIWGGGFSDAGLEERIRQLRTLAVGGFRKADRECG
jgi:hypothetical protein